MELIEDITSYLHNNLVTTRVFIDLRKTFDTIDHSILIKKLCHYVSKVLLILQVGYKLFN